MNTNTTLPNDEGPIFIVTPKRLSNRYVDKLQLSQEKEVTITGWKLSHNKLQEDYEESVELFRYLCYADYKKKKKLMKGTEVISDGYTAYFFIPNKRFIVIIFFLLLLTCILAFFLRDCNGVNLNKPKHSIISENKQETASSEDVGIVYSGFPAEFTINKKVKYLSVQNSIDNENNFYTTVKLMEDDKVIYDMGSDLIQPGKYVNIDLYNLLSPGKHTVTIYQYGYAMNDTFTQAASNTNQIVTITVEK